MSQRALHGADGDEEEKNNDKDDNDDYGISWVAAIDDDTDNHDSMWQSPEEFCSCLHSWTFGKLVSSGPFLAGWMGIIQRDTEWDLEQ